MLVAKNLLNQVGGRIDDHTFGTAEMFLTTIGYDRHFIAKSKMKRRTAVQRELAFGGSGKHVSRDTCGGRQGVDFDLLERLDSGGREKVRANQAGAIVIGIERGHAEPVDFAADECSKHG